MAADVDQGYDFCGDGEEVVGEGVCEGLVRDVAVGVEADYLVAD